MKPITSIPNKQLPHYSSTIKQAKPDIDHDSPPVFRRGARGTRAGWLLLEPRPNHHSGEKWESDKKRNKSQQLMRIKKAAVKPLLLSNAISG
jgi:hypothetical protein